MRLDVVERSCRRVLAPGGQARSAYHRELDTQLPPGFYVVLRVAKERVESRDQALEELRARHPGKIIGRACHGPKHWGWQVQSRPLPTQAP